MPVETAAPAAPWYRHPWVWFIIALPLTSVVASLYFVFLAVQHKDDLVRDDWYKAGRAINKDMHADARAFQRGLSGVLVLDPAVPAVTVTLAPAEDLPDRLQLVLMHSTLAREDMTAMLERGADGAWHGTLPRLPMGKRQLALTPLETEADTWRLRAVDVIFQGVPVPLAPAY